MGTNNPSTEDHNSASNGAQGSGEKTRNSHKGTTREYQKHWKVFSEKLAQRFPPKRQEDMAIELLPGAPTSINCKIYPLNSKETKILKEFLEEEEEKKGYITPGSSPYTAPVFFIGKKDSQELRLVMDYGSLTNGRKGTIIRSLTSRSF